MKKTMWLCSFYRRKTCKSRLITSGRVVVMVGQIYFDVGKKNPKIILDGHDFACHIKELKKTTWICSAYYKTKCKTRLYTTDVIFFDVGTKKPKLVLHDFDFLLYKKEQEYTIWRCSHYFNSRVYRCKCRLFTTGRIVKIDGEHNHEAKIKKDKYKNMLSQRVTVMKQPQGSST
ncbi:hypothetical protein HHI36_012686 [Cryptolaemus montrouzieri]|uniref:FLYWCH-type domain-containing protein n=1 Tax=Cryptolaemus montrouzieri TaxID=559131 RepID=A0ABD2NF82_9CUCU